MEKVYTNLLSKYMSVKNCSIELIAMSSDVAETAVRFYPCFVVDNVKVPLSGGTAVKHIGQVTIDTVDNRLSAVFNAFEAACRSLATLGDIPISNKKNTMIKAFSRLKFPQKYASEICEKYSNTSTTALDVYTSMCEVLAVMKGKLPNVSVLNYEDTLTKVITFNRTSWTHLDIPGDVAWNAKDN